MYLSQQKNNSFLQSDQRNKYFTKDQYAPSKVNVLPPKMQRVVSVSSNVYPEIPSPISLSQQSKPSRNFSKNKSYFLNPPKSVKDSFNSHSQYKALSNQDLFQRYSCNLDLQKNSDILKNNGKMYFSTDRRIQQDLQSRVRQLQEKMRKNQQNMKFYCEQIGHFKMQLSSSSSSNLLDSINTNTLTNSTRDALKQISNIQSFNNKQNLNKNILSSESVMNSSKELDIEKKLKQVDLIKKQIKKIILKQQNLKGHVKMFHDSMKDMVKSFKQHLERSLESLIKRQDKNKKKIFDQVTQTINEKMKQIQNLQSQNLKKALESVKRDQKGKENLRNLQVGKQRFIGDPILIKVRQEVLGLTKKQSQVNSFYSYVDMIKRSLGNDLSKPNPFSSLQNIKDSRQIYGTTQQKILIQETQTTYYLDPEGYLIDSQGYYLIDNDEKIKLSPNQLQKLQQDRILQ